MPYFRIQEHCHIGCVSRSKTLIRNPYFSFLESKPDPTETAVLISTRNRQETKASDGCLDGNFVGRRLETSHPRNIQLAGHISLVGAGGNKLANFFVTNVLSPSIVDAFDSNRFDSSALPILATLQFHVCDHIEDLDYYSPHVPDVAASG